MDKTMSGRLRALLLFYAVHIKKSAIHIILGSKPERIADITDILCP